MADPKIPNQASTKSKAEGERWKSDPDTIENADRDENPEALYDSEDVDDAGGITNRPLTDEVENQGSLPRRGEQRRGKTDGR
jgi:hypothetical protein